MEPILIVGASGLAREVIPVLRESGRQVIGVLDDRIGLLPRTVGGVPVVGSIDDAGLFPDAQVLVCVGAGAGRRSIVERLTRAGVSTDRYARVIDPSVRNPAQCAVGAGSILLAGVTVTADAVIGRHVVAMPGVTVTHDCLVEDYVTFAAGVALGGGTHIGEAAYLGMNASIRQGVAVGAGATVGMGAAVLQDVPAGQTWVGVPAAPLGVNRIAGARIEAV